MQLERLISGYLSKNLDDNEKKKFEKWINKDEGNQLILDDYRKIWQISAMIQSKREVTFDAGDGWDKLQQAIKRAEKKDSEDKKTQIDINDFPRGIRNYILEEK